MIDRQFIIWEYGRINLRIKIVLILEIAIKRSVNEQLHALKGQALAELMLYPIVGNQKSGKCFEKIKLLSWAFLKSPSSIFSKIFKYKASSFFGFKTNTVSK